MTPEEFHALLRPITDFIGAQQLDKVLEAALNNEFASGGKAFKSVETACRAAIDAGWMCSREAGGIKYGRVIKPDEVLSGFSVDVVEMDSIRGPHHAHPNGEIDMIMPQSGDAEFDGQRAGWLVYEPGSAHHPTVTGGRALILYLLPDGAIEFTNS